MEIPLIGLVPALDQLRVRVVLCVAELSIEMPAMSVATPAIGRSESFDEFLSL
jgi:hypothetical protein